MVTANPESLCNHFVNAGGEKPRDNVDGERPLSPADFFAISSLKLKARSTVAPTDNGVAGDLHSLICPSKFQCQSDAVFEIPFDFSEMGSKSLQRPVVMARLSFPETDLTPRVVLRRNW